MLNTVVGSDKQHSSAKTCKTRTKPLAGQSNSLSSAAVQQCTVQPVARQMLQHLQACNIRAIMDTTPIHVCLCKSVRLNSLL